MIVKKWFKQLFCRHDWEHKMRIDKFAVLSGDRFDIVCKKCGKVKGTYFGEYNEDGTGYV